MVPDEFSKRHGFKKPPDILVRNDAPKKFSEALRAAFQRFGYGPQDIGESHRCESCWQRSESAIEAL